MAVDKAKIRGINIGTELLDEAEKAGVEVLAFNQRGFKTYVGPAFEMGMDQAGCIHCGQCVNACPTAALSEHSNIEEVIQAINDPNKIVVFQVAPAVRAALGEEFGLPFGTRVNGKIAASLRRIGGPTCKVFDTNFGADLTIMEEAYELIERINKDGVLPMITSCSPGWIRLVEQYRPEIIPNLSSCKSPQQMFGAILKSYWAEKNSVNPTTIYCVSVMPCIAKKSELKREEMNVNGIQDVDASITTRELARMIRMYGLDFVNLPDEDIPLENELGYAIADLIKGLVLCDATTKNSVNEDCKSANDFVIVNGKKISTDGAIVDNGINWIYFWFDTEDAALDWYKREFGIEYNRDLLVKPTKRDMPGKFDDKFGIGMHK